MAAAQSNIGLLEAAVAGDATTARQMLQAGADPDQTDDHGWTPLTWAAGKGARPVVELLLEAGADPFVCADDGRTPYLVAAAAGHTDVARMLAQAEQAAGGDQDRISSRLHETQPYCRAYQRQALRAFDGWQEMPVVIPDPCPSHIDPELLQPLTDDDILYVHRSLRVTRSIFEDELIVFEGDAPDWSAFCTEVLKFEPFNDFDWMGSQSARDTTEPSESDKKE